MPQANLDRKILRSSVWLEDVYVRLLWVTCICLADEDGSFYCSRSALAREANMTRAQLEEALPVLMGPDPDSTSKELEGIRLVEVSPNRWQLVNYLRHKEVLEAEQRATEEAEKAELIRTKERDKKRRQRASLSCPPGKGDRGGTGGGQGGDTSQPPVPQQLTDAKQPSKQPCGANYSVRDNPSLFEEDTGTQGTQGPTGLVEETPVLVIPCRKAGEVYGLSPRKLAEYQASYPHIDVLAEFRKARQWCIDNPANRKTKGRMGAFLTAWLNRAKAPAARTRANEARRDEIAEMFGGLSDG